MYIRLIAKKLRHVFFVWIVLAVLLVIAGGISIVHQQQARPGSLTAVPTPLPHTTYYSNKLGISFAYIPMFPNGIGQYFFVKEIGDTIYLYWVPGSTKPFTGSDSEFLQTIAPASKSVEVLKKDTQQSLTDAIQGKFLTGYSQSDCFVKLAPYGYPHQNGTFQSAIIEFSHNSKSTPQQAHAAMARCPKYVNGFGIRYFMMDQNHPDKLLFVNLGQDNLPSGIGGYTWDETIAVSN